MKTTELRYIFQIITCGWSFDVAKTTRFLAKPLDSTAAAERSAKSPKACGFLQVFGLVNAHLSFFDEENNFIK